MRASTVTHQVPPHLRCVQIHRAGPSFQKHLHSTCPAVRPLPDAQGPWGISSCLGLSGSKYLLTFSPFPPHDPWMSLKGTVSLKCSQTVSSASPQLQLPLPLPSLKLTKTTQAPQPSLWCHHGALTPSLMSYGWHGPLRLKEGCVSLRVLKAPKPHGVHVWLRGVSISYPVLGKGLGYSGEFCSGLVSPWEF